MGLQFRSSCVCVGALAGLVGWCGLAQPTYAAGAIRNLSGYSAPGVAFTISISLDIPQGTIAAAVEETPPAGWTVSEISDGGEWDTQSAKVKWGPFFDPSIPAIVTYDAVPPGGVQGMKCFEGTASFDGLDLPVSGDDCIAIGVPTLSTWGTTAMALLMLLMGTLLLVRHRANLRRIPAQ